MLSRSLSLTHTRAHTHAHTHADLSLARSPMLQMKALKTLSKCNSLSLSHTLSAFSLFLFPAKPDQPVFRQTHLLQLFKNFGSFIFLLSSTLSHSGRSFLVLSHSLSLSLPLVYLSSHCLILLFKSSDFFSETFFIRSESFG